MDLPKHKHDAHHSPLLASLAHMLDLFNDITHLITHAPVRNILQNSCGIYLAVIGVACNRLQAMFRSVWNNPVHSSSHTMASMNVQATSRLPMNFRWSWSIGNLFIGPRAIRRMVSAIICWRAHI